MAVNILIYQTIRRGRLSFVQMHIRKPQRRLHHTYTHREIPVTIPQPMLLHIMKDGYDDHRPHPADECSDDDERYHRRH